MKLLMLGTTGYHPNDLRHTACFMLPETGVVFDAGTGMYRVRDHLCTATLDIFLTHGHLDHVIGLTFLFDVLSGHEMERVCVHGDRGKLQDLADHLFAETLFPVPPPFAWQPLTEQVVLADGGLVTHFPLRHPGGALGYRVDWPDRSLAYVTDTTADPEADYIERIRGVDLLIHECYFPDGHETLARKTGHSWTTPVARVAASADVRRLLLVHVNPLSHEADPIGLETARAIFPNTDLGFDNMHVEF